MKWEAKMPRMHGNWWAGAIVWKREPDGLHFLVQEAESFNRKYFGKKRIGFPGGTTEDHPEDLSAEFTMRREVKDETGLVVKDGVSCYILCSINERKKKKMFSRIFYLIWLDDCGGSLRKGYKFDGDDKLFPPYWVKAETASFKKLQPTHRFPLLKALQYFNLVG